MNVPDEGYSRNVLFTLSYVSMFFFIISLSMFLESWIVHTCIQESRIGIVLTGLILLCLLSKPGHAFPVPCRWSFICSMIWSERWLFVLLIFKELLTFILWTVLGIVDLHSLNFPIYYIFRTQIKILSEPITTSSVA